jgi:hypothetical protein
MQPKVSQAAVSKSLPEPVSTSYSLVWNISIHRVVTCHRLHLPLSRLQSVPGVTRPTQNFVTTTTIIYLSHATSAKHAVGTGQKAVFYVTYQLGVVAERPNDPLVLSPQNLILTKIASAPPPLGLRVIRQLSHLSITRTLSLVWFLLRHAVLSFRASSLHPAWVIWSFPCRIRCIHTC